MAEIRETLTVTGIHCMRCIGEIAEALRAVDGLVGGSATLAGDVHVVYDDADPALRRRLERALAAAGFPLAADG